MNDSGDEESADVLTPELVVRAYCMGAFPMADSRDGEIGWYSPDPRAVLPIEESGFKVSRSLSRRVRSGCYHVTRDRAFDQVIRACALPRADDADTWINKQIIEVYSDLHTRGIAHSVEAWQSADATASVSADSLPPDATLVGGLYGVALGGVFFGESMFHRATDASKVCLVALVEHLRTRGFKLLDVQFVNPHLEQFGVIELPRDVYMERLEGALKSHARW